MLVHLGIGGHVDCLTKLFGSQKRCCNGQWLLTSHYFEHCIYKEFNGCIYYKNLHLPQKLYLTWLTLIPHELLFQHTLQCSSRSKVKLSILKSKSDSSLLSVEKLCQTKLFFFWLQIGCFVTGANLLRVEEDDQTFFGIFNFFLLCFLSISSSLSLFASSFCDLSFFFPDFGNLCHPKYDLTLSFSQHSSSLSFPLLSLDNKVPLTHLLNLATLNPTQQEGLCKSFVILHFLLLQDWNIAIRVCNVAITICSVVFVYWKLITWH